MRWRVGWPMPAGIGAAGREKGPQRRPLWGSAKRPVTGPRVQVRCLDPATAEANVVPGFANFRRIGARLVGVPTSVGTGSSISSRGKLQAAGQQYGRKGQRKKYFSHGDFTS